MLTESSLLIYIMYKYVKNKLDYSYCETLPKGVELSEQEIPLEEIEIREMIEAWYQSAYAPLFGEDQTFWDSLSLDSKSTIKGDWLSSSEKEKRSRLERLESTILTVLRSHVYFASFRRVLTTLPQSPTQYRLNNLLLKASNEAPLQH
ncbi:hypothetical protein J4N45_06535 [Vibrio sp. SCSIO 43140]|uniref:hypothetical protein n=1 Tax=Vibrio sp. SCSIO 43140 TaxID=2819100 RepID=UPI00207658A3|nr:hypothetical protein [Vibrio sp. SCSIO 43140]USD61611.1 hypothetical protein J4N45_06535 [Vibrio sp. SCSIO 43140]